MSSETKPRPPARREHLRVAAFWAGVAAFAGAAVIPYLLGINPALREAAMSPLVLAGAQALQSALLVFPLALLGLWLGRPLGLGSPVVRRWLVEGVLSVDRRGLGIAVAAGLIGGALTPLLDAAFAAQMPPMITTPAALEVQAWTGLLASFYGGINEELLMRLGAVTILTWLVTRVRASDRRGPAPRWALGVAIVGAALLFGALHLPAAAAIWPLTPIVIARTIVLNAALGVLFGALYASRGLEYAMVAHFCADLVLHVALPLLG